MAATAVHACCCGTPFAVLAAAFEQTSLQTYWPVRDVLLPAVFSSHTGCHLLKLPCASSCKIIIVRLSAMAGLHLMYMQVGDTVVDCTFTCGLLRVGQVGQGRGAGGPCLLCLPPEVSQSVARSEPSPAVPSPAAAAPAPSGTKRPGGHWPSCCFKGRACSDYPCKPPPPKGCVMVVHMCQAGITAHADTRTTWSNSIERKLLGLVRAVGTALVR